MPKKQNSPSGKRIGKGRKDRYIREIALQCATVGGLFMRFSSSYGVIVLAAVGLAGFAGCSLEAESLFASSFPNANSGGAGGKGGDGGLGGAAGEGGAAQSSTSSSSSSSASSSSSGGLNQQACGQCSFQACQQEIFACGQACQGYFTCIQGCMDATCANDCVAKFPEGKPIQDCTCKSCTADCGALCDSGSGSSSSSSSSSSGASCSTCSQLLQGNLGQPCPGSGQLIGAVFTCACQQNCAMACGTTCQSGAQPDQTCFACVGQKCGSELQACLQD